MKRFFSIILILIFFLILNQLLTVNSSNSEKYDKIKPIWLKTYGIPNHWDVGNSVQQTTDGGYIIVGTTSSSVSAEPDIWLIKTDDKGNKQWDKTFGGTGYDVCHSVQQTIDGGFIFGGYTSTLNNGWGDIWLIKTDENGDKQWDMTYGKNGSEIANNVQQCNDGGYVILGYIYPYGADNKDIFLIKTNENGIEQWNKTYGKSYNDEGVLIKQISNNGYLIMGVVGIHDYGYYDIWLIKIDKNGNEKWNKTYHKQDINTAYTLCQTHDNNYILTGYTRNTTSNNNDIWILKIDQNGNELWNQTYGGEYSEEGYSTFQVSNDEYITFGYETDHEDLHNIILIKIDQYGNEIWTKKLEELKQYAPHFVIQINNEDYLIVGRILEEETDGVDIFLLKINSEKNPNDVQNEDKFYNYFIFLWFLLIIGFVILIIIVFKRKNKIWDRKK